MTDTGHKMQKEDEVQKQCLDYLTIRNIYHWRQNSGCAKIGKRFIRFTTIIGISDILGICPDGRFLAIECKREKGGVVSTAQKLFLQNIKNNGGVAIVVHSLDDMVQQLKENKVI